MSTDTLPRHAAFSYVDGIHTSDAMLINNASDQASGLVVDPGPGTRSVDAADIGKLALRTDNLTRWILRAVSPASWVSCDGAWNARGWSAALSFAMPGTTQMPTQTVSGAIAFTAVTTGAIAGANLCVNLLANGTNVPTFSLPLREHGSSSGYSNTAGHINILSAWFDGTYYWFSWSQPTSQPDTTAPTLVSAAVPGGAPTTIVLTYNEALDTGSVPATSAYAVTNSGGTQNVTGVAVSGVTVTLTTSRTVVSTDTITLNYTVPGTNPVRDAAANNAAALTSQSVTNGVGATGTILRLATINGANFTEGGNGTTGWTYTQSGGAHGSAFAGDPSLSLAAGANGSFTCRISAVSGGFPIFVVQPAGTVQTYNAVASFGIYVITTASNQYGGVNNGVASGVTVTRNWATNDLVRLRRQGTVLFVEVSSDNGVSFTEIHQYTGFTTGAIECSIEGAGAGNAFGPITGTGLT